MNNINKDNYQLNTNAIFKNLDLASLTLLVGKEKAEMIFKLINNWEAIENFGEINNLKISWWYETKYNNNFDKEVYNKFHPKLMAIKNENINLINALNFDYKSEGLSNSSYIIIEDLGVLRVSDHWGNSIRTCNWNLEGEEIKECYKKNAVGFAKFDEFESNNEK